MQTGIFLTCLLTLKHSTTLLSKFRTNDIRSDCCSWVTLLVCVWWDGFSGGKAAAAMGVSGAGEIVQQEYEPPTLPSGFIFKFALLSTWDDRFYIGLNGLELYDQFDRIVPITTDNLHVVCTGGGGFPRLLLPRVGCAA